MARVIPMKRSALPWYAEDREDRHPLVDAEIDWMLHGRCVHQPSDVDRGVLHMARDCTDCLQARNSELARKLDELLAPVVRLSKL